MDPVDSNVVYLEFQGLNIFKSLDGGNTAVRATNGITEDAGDFNGILFFTLDPNDSLRLYVGGTQLWRTLDGAAHWTAASAPIPPWNNSKDRISRIAISPSDPNLVLFGTDFGRIYRNTAALTSDQSATLSYASPREEAFISEIQFDPNQPQTVYATYSTFLRNRGDAHVYKSLDSGATWAPIDGSGSTGLPDVPVESLAVDPDDGNRLYLGTDLGMFASIDGGATWMRDDNPFANVIVEHLALSRNGDAKYLYAFTYGRGVWRVPLPGSVEDCAYTLSATSIAAPASGGTGSLDITTASNCTWTALTTSPGMVRVQSPAAGTGSGTVVYKVAPNPNTQPRTVTLNVQDQIVTVAQAGTR